MKLEVLHLEYVEYVIGRHLHYMAPQHIHILR